MSPSGGALRSKLAVALISTAVVSVALASFAATWLIRQSEQRVALQELRRQAQALAGEVALVGGQPRQTLRLLRRATDLSGAAAYRIAPDGNPVLVAGESRLELSTSDLEQIKAGRSLEGVRETPGGKVIFVAQPLASRQRGVFVVLARPGNLGVSSVPIAGPLLAAAAMAVAAAAAVSLLLSKRIANPMLELARATRELARGRFDSRVKIDSRDEIGEVGEAFNRMAEELEGDEKRQRDFLMSISHELRTPLTAIQGYAEAIEDGTVTDGNEVHAAGVIIGESKRLTRLIADLLDLARLDGRRFTISTGPVEIASVLETVRQNFAPRAAECGVTISTDPSDAAVTADSDRLVQILSNFVENALRYTPSGGSINLSSTVNRESARITVSDTGPGFREADLEHAFERQYLWTNYRGLREAGTGLGLVICRELAELMGGRVTAANGTAGGAVFAVELPLAGHPSTV